jgi:uncharacterized membrane protein YidH (DUF202 family)
MVVRANIDRLAGWMLIAAGGISVVVGWVQVSAATGPGAQLSYLVSGGFIGLLLMLAGVSALLTADLADRQRRLERRSSPLASRRRHGPVVIRAGVLAAALLALGWNGASSASDGSSALPGTLLAAVGVVLAAAAVSTNIARWSRRLDGAIDVRESGVLAGAVDDDAAVIVAPGLTRFHRRRCLALAGVDGRAVGRNSVGPGLRPCGICHTGLPASQGHVR